MKDISKLIEKKEEPKKEKTNDDILQNIIMADMEVMLKLKHGRNGGNNFPDPVEPQWKN